MIARSNNFSPLILGLSFGLGYATEWRIGGVFGPSEFLMMIYLVISFLNYQLKIFSLHDRVLFPLLFFQLIILTPIVTIAVLFTTELRVMPEYILHFVIIFFLMSAWFLDFKNDFDFILFVKMFFYTFVISVGISYFFADSWDPSGDSGLAFIRFSSWAVNPNTPIFFATSLMLLISIYLKKNMILYLSAVVLVCFPMGSDALFLSLGVALLVIFYSNIIPLRTLSPGAYFSVSVIFLLSFLYLIFLNYYEDIISLWSIADQGNGRIKLMKSGLEFATTSPILGHGYGAYATLFGRQRWEAHSTFIDLFLIFGLILPTFIYITYFRFIGYLLKTSNIAGLAFMCAFVVTSMFHFTGRHYFFWFEFILFFYVLQSSQIIKRERIST
jgi:hypothetical protein